MVAFWGYGDITRNDVLRALREFDAEYPDTNEYDHWLERGNYKWAIDHDGRLYPPKYIRSLITGKTTRTFWGGKPTNRVFEEHNFDIIEKPQRSPRPRLSR